MSPPMRLFRPDFRIIFKNFSPYLRELYSLTMDGTYSNIIKTVDDESLDETDTAALVRKCMSGMVEQPEKCFEVIMDAIWPPLHHHYIMFEVPDPVSTPNTYTNVQTSIEVNVTPAANDIKIFQVIDARSTIVMNDNRASTWPFERPGASSPLPHIPGSSSTPGTWIKNLKRRSRDDRDDVEETARPTARLCIEAPPPSSPADDNIARASTAFAPIPTPSSKGKGSSHNGNSKKRTRDFEEDEEETARHSPRVRQESPATRYPSPTPSESGTGVRFNPWSSPEADNRSSRNEGNSLAESLVSPSGSSTEVSRKE